jgi:hypothetical protein
MYETNILLDLNVWNQINLVWDATSYRHFLDNRIAGRGCQVNFQTITSCIPYKIDLIPYIKI